MLRFSAFLVALAVVTATLVVQTAAPVQGGPPPQGGAAAPGGGQGRGAAQPPEPQPGHPSGQFVIWGDSALFDGRQNPQTASS